MAAKGKKMLKAQRVRAFLQRKHGFKKNGLLLIKKMLELNENSSGRNAVLVDEILHSILFLGEINDPHFPPDKIVPDEEVLEELQRSYPRPFDLYKSQVPRRSPFSCVLDMVLKVTGRKKEAKIIKKLQEIISDLEQGKKNQLFSSVICVSQKKKDIISMCPCSGSKRFYGVSMSTCGKNPGRIMIAASCLAYWHSYVADAVMTYYPQKVKKSYFDGTIKLPEHVRCQAFNIRPGTPTPPCTSCGNLFGLKKSASDEFDYGNCAEAESVSNLLKNEADVREWTELTSEKYTEEHREMAKNNVSAELRELLKDVRFKWDGNFYNADLSSRGT